MRQVLQRRVTLRKAVPDDGRHEHERAIVRLQHEIGNSAVSALFQGRAGTTAAEVRVQRKTPSDESEAKGGTPVDSAPGSRSAGPRVALPGIGVISALAVSAQRESSARRRDEEP